MPDVREILKWNILVYAFVSNKNNQLLIQAGKKYHFNDIEEK